jgi:hypothetical protein
MTLRSVSRNCVESRLERLRDTGTSRNLNQDSLSPDRGSNRLLLNTSLESILLLFWTLSIIQLKIRTTFRKLGLLPVLEIAFSPFHRDR